METEIEKIKRAIEIIADRCLLGNEVNLVLNRTAMTEFLECDTCSAKPGMVSLCKGCLHNRRLIDHLLGR